MAHDSSQDSSAQCAGPETQDPRPETVLVPEGLPGDILHDNEVLSFVVQVDFFDVADIGVFQCGGRLGFPDEALVGEGGIGEVYLAERESEPVST